MYVKSMKDDYTLFDAFNFLGMRLYGPEWSGYEVWRHRVEDPTPVLEERTPLEEEVENIATQLSAKCREQKKVVGRKEISGVNIEIDDLRNEQSELFYQLRKIGDVHKSEIEDHGRWERFEYAEGILLKALCNEDLAVICTFGSVVKPSLWAEFPEGFWYDLENSLIFLPSNESSKMMNSGRIKQEQFEDWLKGIVPIVSSEDNEPTDEMKAYLWFEYEVKNWDGKTKKPQFRDMAIKEYSISGRCFNERIWSLLATKEMIAPGPKTKNKSSH